MMKRSLIAGTAVVVLCASGLAWAAGDSAPVLVWSQQAPGWGQPGASANVYYGGGVFNGQFYTAELNWGPQVYGPTQTGDPPTAMVRDFRTATEASAYNGARTSVLIGDYNFFNRQDKSVGMVHLNRLNSDWTNLVAFPEDNMNNDVAPEGMTTDGTFLFTTQSTVKNVIRKYAIDNQPDSFTLTKTLEITVAGANTFRAISHYNGFLYVVDNLGSKGIYEINASTGEYRQLGTHVGETGYQAVRYGNRLFVIDGRESGATQNLTIYTISGGTLATSKSYNLTESNPLILGLWGIGVIGNGNNVAGFWVTSSNAFVSFFSYKTCNEPFADSNGDGVVDMNDFAAFQACYLVDGMALEQVQSYFCKCFDVDDDGKVDLADLRAFEACASGPAIPWTSSTECP